MRWIKIHTKLLEWEWASCPETLSLWIHLLLTANYEDKKWKGITVPRGSLIASSVSLAENTGLSRQQVRTSLIRLKSTNEITITPTNKYSLITICKYNDYQISDSEINQQDNQQPNHQATNNQPTNNQQITTPLEYKNIDIKEDKEKYISKDIYKEKEESVAVLDQESKKVVCKDPKHLVAPRIRLTDKEVANLKRLYGEEDYQGIIEYFSSYKIEKNYTSQSDNLTIQRWVADAYFKKKASSTRPQRQDKFNNMVDIFNSFTPQEQPLNEEPDEQ